MTIIITTTTVKFSLAKLSSLLLYLLIFINVLDLIFDVDAKSLFNDYNLEHTSSDMIKSSSSSIINYNDNSNNNINKNKNSNSLDQISNKRMVIIDQHRQQQQQFRDKRQQQKDDYYRDDNDLQK